MLRRSFIGIIGLLAAVAGMLAGPSLLGGVTTAAADGQAPTVFAYPSGPPATQEGITVRWEVQSPGVFWVTIHRESPPADWTSFNAVGTLTDTNLQRDREYRYRACAVYEFSQSCSDWVGARIPSPAPSSPPPSQPSQPSQPPQPPRPAPKALPQPVLRAEGAGNTFPNYGIVRLTWTNPVDDAQRSLLTGMEWYQNGKVIYSGTDTTQRDAPVLANSGPYRYQLCIKNAVDEQCSEEVSASPTPTKPTAPVDVKLERIDLPGGRGPNGIVLRPKQRVGVTWFNTDVPGTFFTVERQDTRASRNPDPNSPVEYLSGTFWYELERLSGAGLPTSALVDPQARGELTLTIGKTYRVCAVVPALGNEGKVCSQPVSLP
jgi:hypothetical protein